MKIHVRFGIKQSEFSWSASANSKCSRFVEEGKSRKQNCRRKVRQAPWIVIIGKMEKPAKFTSLWFETLVECKASVAKRRKHIFHERKRRLNILYKTRLLIFLISHQHLSRVPAAAGRTSQSQAQPGFWCQPIWTGSPLQNLLSWRLPESLLFWDLL